MPDIRMSHKPDENSFQLTEGDTVIGLARYRDEEGVRSLTHTEVDPDRQGEGLASRLIRFALDTTREQGLRVRAVCPMVADYVARHREYDDLLEG